ncbi:amidase [Hyalangium versicolor]|uniref:amidase n=1 Tax=Hyalangium versicolor TaxID=2861190 RepID=UPI001CCA2DB7|nr:amidase [Hyalangium versicolor]
MTRNVKRFLALPLLALTPVVAVAAEPAANDFVSKRSEFTPLRPAETVELQVMKGEGRPAQMLADVAETFYIGNWTGVVTYAGGSLTGSSVPFPLPNPLNFTTPYTYSGAAQALVPALTPWTQTFGYTTNPADPYGQAKTCIWTVSVTVTGGVCSGSVSVTAYGAQGGLCFIDTGSSIDPASCQAVVGVGLQ